ncbi:NAD(P)H-hydrate dehydratase, partial [Candidatus Margulisiibacteriota bacterium]
GSLELLPVSIITPHPGEMSRLMDISVSEIQADRENAAREAAARFRTIVVLKGDKTVVSDGEKVYTNQTGNPGMATAGMGDVLTGVISSLLSQDLSPWDAACSGVYLHGAAGDLAYKDKSVGLIAGDVVEMLPEVMLN